MQRHRSSNKLFVARFFVAKLFTALGGLLLAVSLTSFAFAQAKAPAKAPAKSAEKMAAPAPAQRQLLSVQFLRIKSGMAAEWREFRKNESIPMQQKAGTKEQRVWNTAIFGEGGFIIATPIESLAQYDGPSPAVRALGQEGATAYGAKAARFVESARTIAIETRPELSIPLKPGEQYKLAIVTTTTIAPGRDDEYENFVKTAVLPAIKKAAPKGYLISRVVYGGNLNQYLSVVLLDSFADLQRWREAFAKEGATAKLAAKSAGIVTNRENAIYRFVPDLSVMPPAQSAGNK